jgi:hypothetical protein
MKNTSSKDFRSQGDQSSDSKFIEGIDTIMLAKESVSTG